MLPRQVFKSYVPIRRSDNRFRFCIRCSAELEERTTGGRKRKSCPTCGFVQYENPTPAVSILVVEGPRFVLCRRSARAFQGGKWCLPCGYVEFHEDFLSAARREVKEETGLEVRISSVLSVVSNFLSPSIHSVVSVLLAEPIGGNISSDTDGENDAVAWFSKDDGLPEMAFEADEHIIERYFQDRSLGVPVESDFAGPIP